MPRRRRKPDPPKPRRRARRSGTVSHVERLDRWEARLPRSLGRTATYHQHRVDAERWLAQEIGRREQSVLPGADESLGRYLERWLARQERVFGPSRLIQAQQMVGKAESLWTSQLANLRYQHIADWVNGLLTSGLAPSTINLYKGLLAQALSDLVPDVIATNPAARAVRLPRSAKSDEPEHLEELEAQRFLKLAEGTPGYPLWRLLLGTGLRIQEALGLTWERINLETGEAEISEQWNRRGDGPSSTKSGRPRTVMLSAAVLDALLELPYREGLVFRGMRTKGRPRPISYSTAHGWFQEAARTAKLPPGITPHSLRHTFATICLARSVPITDIADALGHANASLIPKVYAHALRQRRGSSERTMEEALSGVF